MKLRGLPSHVPNFGQSSEFLGRHDLTFHLRHRPSKCQDTQMNSTNTDAAEHTHTQKKAEVCAHFSRSKIRQVAISIPHEFKKHPLSCKQSTRSLVVKFSKSRRDHRKCDPNECVLYKLLTPHETQFSYVYTGC